MKFVDANTASVNGPLPIPASLAYYEGDIEGTLTKQVPHSGTRSRSGYTSMIAPDAIGIRVGKALNALPGILSLFGGIAMLAVGGLILYFGKR